MICGSICGTALQLGAWTIIMVGLFWLMGVLQLHVSGPWKGLISVSTGPRVEWIAWPRVVFWRRLFFRGASWIKTQNLCAYEDGRFAWWLTDCCFSAIPPSELTAEVFSELLRRLANNSMLRLPTSGYFCSADVPSPMSTQRYMYPSDCRVEFSETRSVRLTACQIACSSSNALKGSE